jgi:hypothetical protein
MLSRQQCTPYDSHSFNTLKPHFEDCLQRPFFGVWRTGGGAAKKHRARIEEHASKEDKQHHEAIGDHYSKATEHLEALKKELQKLTHDCSEIKPDAGRPLP